MSRVEPNRNVYVGHRYVPLILEEWNNKISYEGLSVVTHKGNSYTSKKRVPVGIDIFNKEFWSMTGNYNAQVDYYREETERVATDLLLKSDKTYVDTELGKKANQTYVNTELGKKANQTYVDTELGKKANQSDVNTELGKKSDKTYVDTELDKKANQTYVNTELGKKANQTYVNTEIDKTNLSVSKLESTFKNISLYPRLSNETSDGNRLIRAINDYKEKGGVIFIPSGDYLINNTIEIPSNIKLLGEQGTNFLSTVENINILLLSGNDVTIENITFNNIKGTPILIGNSQYFNVINNEILNSDKGIDTQGVPKNGLIKGNKINTIANNGIRLSNTLDVKIVNNVINNTYAGIYINENKNLIISDNNIGKTSFSSGITGNSIYLTITNNSIHDSGEHNIYLNSSNDVYIVNNILNNTGTYREFGSGIKVGTDLNQKIKNVNISGNTITNVNGRGLQIVEGASDITIKDNIISYCQFDGITLTYTLNVIIEGNIIKNNGLRQSNTYSGIFLFGESSTSRYCKNTVIVNNNISDDQTSKTQKDGVNVNLNSNAPTYVINNILNGNISEEQTNVRHDTLGSIVKDNMII